MNEKDVQHAYNLLEQHRRFLRVLNQDYSPEISVTTGQGGVGWDNEWASVSIDDITASFDKDSEFFKTLRHMVKNVFYNRLQEIEHKLQLLGVEVPSREKQADTSTYVSSSRSVLPNWLKEDVK